jgi:hypothetical protein
MTRVLQAQHPIQQVETKALAREGSAKHQRSEHHVPFH